MRELAQSSPDESDIHSMTVHMQRQTNHDTVWSSAPLSSSLQQHPGSPCSLRHWHSCAEVLVQKFLQ